MTSDEETVEASSSTSDEDTASPEEIRAHLESEYNKAREREIELTQSLKSTAAERRRLQHKLGMPTNSERVKYVRDGLVGETLLGEFNILTQADLDKGMLPIPKEYDNDKAAKTRKKRNYEVDRHGVSFFWAPAGSTSKAKNKVGADKENKNIVEALVGMFGTKKCTLSESSQAHLAIGKLYAPGCSDEGSLMIMASTIRMSRTGLALPIDYDDIAGGLPSRAQIAEIEPVVAALCLMHTSQQLLEHNVSTVGGQGDHGNRRRIDHYPKTIHAAIPMDKDREKWSIISPTLDIDGCHHTTDACV